MSKNIKSSPLDIIGGAITALGAIDWGGKRRKATQQAQDEYNEMRDQYMGMDFSNLYSDVSNPYANMENVMEDLTVNQQQAQFQQEMVQKGQANVLAQTRQAAGSSGGAGLAQAMLAQMTEQAAGASASIGQQEAANQKAAAQQAGQLQTMERQGAWKADMTRRAGEEQQRAQEQDRTRTLFAMSQNKLSSARGAEEAARDQLWSGIGQMGSSIGGGLIG
tara:strand:- start:463 stop:1122 length:660 start_codon:yes stop_codon:yes gene_type:complete